MGLTRGLGAGHTACAGCPAPTIVQAAIYAAREGLGCEPVVTFATGCMEVASSVYPHNAWRLGFLHSGFANSASIASGVEAAIWARRKRGELPAARDIKVLAFGGDGGTYDIGLQALSGAMERGHDLTYICYNNEAYMNTGIQHSSATPSGAFSHTARSGKRGQSKDLTRIMIAHDLPYVAQACVARYQDMINKLAKAIAVKGPAFVNVLSSCPLGWGLPHTDDVLSVADLAVECNAWPLYECENGRYRITYRPAQPRPVRQYVQMQGRFSHLLEPGGRPALDRLQEMVDSRWAELNRLERTSVEPRA
ncbi:MAG: pyruvate ferredoxin oxidoreductase [Phycisphaerales bacterium]|nr:pyruvate ferredoxin oxidoreductase [Phycisphaerales bacterium]